MGLTLRIALIVVTVIYLFFILRAIKHKKVQLSFSVFWILTGLVLVIALAIPNLVENISHLLGFELTVNMIFCVAIFICFYLIFNLNIIFFFLFFFFFFIFLYNISIPKSARPPT